MISDEKEIFLADATVKLGTLKKKLLEVYGLKIAPMKIDEQYQEAYDKAPEETKRAIESFQEKPKAFRDKKPLLYYILGSGTPPYKMSKEESRYVDKASGKQNCGNCIFTFQNHVKKTYICSQIRGTIKLAGWCKLWAK